MRGNRGTPRPAPAAGTPPWAADWDGPLRPGGTGSPGGQGRGATGAGGAGG
jgi:hypothetical protein